jgi:hypothetical protein
MKVSGKLHAPAALLPGKQPHWVGEWVSLRAGQDAVAKRKLPDPARNRTTVVQPVAGWYGPVKGSCEHGNEPSGSMKGE